jgi:DNA-binding MarR family transcriptional regulator
MRLAPRRVLGFSPTPAVTWPASEARWSAQGGVHFPGQDLGRLRRGDPLSAGGGEAHRVAGRQRSGAFHGDSAAGDEQGISLADYDVLVVLSEATEGRRRVFELADALAWEQSRVSHQLARMQRRGLVARQECPTDARGAFVVLTEAGRAAIERAAPAHVETVRQLVFDGLSRDQLAALTAVSSSVLNRLQTTPPAD